MDLPPEDEKFLRQLQHQLLMDAIVEQQTGSSLIDSSLNKKAASRFIENRIRRGKTCDDESKASHTRDKKFALEEFLRKYPRRLKATKNRPPG
ncbi:hypothetical protein AGA29_01010 [Escherichia coli]|nr:hypothetical protein AGA29_01010 [Escherichia coli]